MKTVDASEREYLRPYKTVVFTGESLLDAIHQRNFRREPQDAIRSHLFQTLIDLNSLRIHISLVTEDT